MTARNERDYWIAYWRAFLRHLAPETHAMVMRRKALWVHHATSWLRTPRAAWLDSGSCANVY